MKQHTLMDIIELRCLKGPNFWSIRHPNLVMLKLNLNELEDYPTNRIENFYERLQALLPSLYSHQCSEGRPGGFFYRVQTGTWMGHVIEHIALEIQSLAGMNVGFGRTRGTGERGIYNVVFAYEDEQAGLYAAREAIAIAEALVSGSAYDLDKTIDTLRRLHAQNRLGPSTSAIVTACQQKGVPYIRFDNDSYVQLGYGAKQQRIQATVTGRTSAIGVDIAADKSWTKRLLEEAGIPVPRGMVVSDESELESVMQELSFPLVVKPLDGNHGRGVTTNIQQMDDLRRAVGVAQTHSRQVVIEQFITGNDYRLLVINNTFCAAAWRLPAMVTGNGRDTIQALIDEQNRDPRRGEGHQNVLTRIEVDAATMAILDEQQLTLDSVLPADKPLFLKKTANLSTGGTSIDVTDRVHPEIKFMAERIARLTGLDICGIDLMANDVSGTLVASGAAVVEVNAGPGLRMHTHPSEGQPRPVGQAIADMLFPSQPQPGEAGLGRIPLIAVTGTNGKTTTTRLLAHLYRQSGRCVGFTTTEGVYIGNHRIEEGDCTGPLSARKILTDPGVEVAVLECARGGLLRGGLAFDQCDVGVVTNVAEDHLGLRGINTLDELAHVKSVIPESVRVGGYAVLNADNDHTYAMRERVNCHVALFSQQAGSDRIRHHCLAGGVAAVNSDGFITILLGRERMRVEQVERIPMTFGGKCPFMIENALAATLAAFCQGLSVDVIAKGLRSFEPTEEQIPGRLNLFPFPDFTVMVDYAHNPHGLTALGTFIRQLDASYRVGIMTGVGDRRDEDLMALGRIAGEIFDEIILRLDEDPRGRNPEVLLGIVQQGIRMSDERKPIHIIPDELTALDYAMQHVRPGSLIVHLSERIEASIDHIHQFNKQKEQPSLSLSTAHAV